MIHSLKHVVKQLFWYVQFIDQCNVGSARLCNDNYDPAKAWSDRVDSGPPLIRTACPQPRPVLPPGADLHRKQWVKLNRLRCGTARVGNTLKLWVVQESATGACGHITQSVQHVVVDCMIHKAPDGFAGLRCPDAATRSWLEDLNIEIWKTGKRLQTYYIYSGIKSCW